MEAEAKVSLNAEGFESGAARVKRANRDMVTDSEAAASRMSRSLRDGGDGARRMSGNMSELAHSGRAVTEMLLSGQGAMRAFQVEAPRLIQALGGGVGAIVGLGAVAAGVGKITESVYEASQAYKDAERSRESFVGGPNAGREVFQKQIDQFSANAKVREEKSGSMTTRIGESIFGAYLQAVDKVTSVVSGSNTGATDTFGLQRFRSSGRDALTGDSGPERARGKQELAERVQARDLAVGLAEGQRKYNDLVEEGMRSSEKTVRVRELELERLEKIDALDRAGSEKRFNSQPLVEQLNREYDLKKKVAELDARNEASSRAFRKERSDIQTPGNVPADAQERYGQVQSAQALFNQYRAAVEAQGNADQLGVNDEEANQRVRDTRNAYDTELRSLAERGKEMEAQTKIQGLQLSGQTTAAGNAASLLSLENQITTAANNRNGELAKQLGIQKEQLQTAQALERFEHPGRVEAERRAGQQYARREANMTVDAGLTRVTRDGSGIALSGYDAEANRYRDTTANEREKALAALRRRGLYDGSTKAVNARGGGLIRDVESIPDHVPLPDAVGPSDLGAYEKYNGRPTSSFSSTFPQLDWARRVRSTSLYGAGAGVALAGIGVEAATLGSGVAESNRPAAPAPSNHAADTGLATQVQTLIAALNRLASQVGSS